MTDRRDYIGGAAVPGILGISPWSSQYKEWAKFVGLIDEEPDNERFMIGRLLEAPIAALFHERTGLVVAGEQMQLQHPDLPHLRGHIDGLVMDGHGEPDIGNALGLFEAKTAGGSPWDDVPEHYAAQGQWYLWLSGLERMWFGVLFGGFGLTFRTYEVTANPSWVARFVAVVLPFWTDHVVTGIAPPIDGGEATTDLIRALFPDHVPGDTVEVPAELVEEWHALRTERLDVEAVAKGLKERQQAVENELRLLMADAEVATVDGVPALTCRTQSRTTVNTETTSRVMRPAPKAKGRAA